MALIDRFRRLFTRSMASAPAAASYAGMATLPPWGSQWPLWGSRYGAENFAAVASCIQSIAGSIASLPATVYRIDGKKRIEQPDHPVARLIRQPNDLQTWCDWLEWWIASALLWGNGLTVVDYDGAGRPTSLYPVPWWCVQPILLPASVGGDGIASPVIPNARLVFDITQTMSPFPLPTRPTGFPVRFFAEDILHLKDRSDDGILGRSRLSRSPDALACALGSQSFSTGLWVNGTVLNGVIQHPGKLSKEAADRIAQSWKDTHTGGTNAGKLAVLEEGMQYEKIGVSPEDAELLETRRFSVIEICRLFGVPPVIVGDWSKESFASSSQADIWFASHTLLPWVAKIEREFNRVVFTSSEYVLSIDVSARLRGDYPTMMGSNIQAVRAGIMSADEARLEAGLDPRGGAADELQAQAIGGRPDGTGEGTGDTLSPPGGRLNGKANGSGLAS
jgi:HK97 family phage portal protein